VVDPIAPIERHLRRRLGSELDRQRFDRAKRFVDETVRRGAGAEITQRMNARWLKFLCSRTPVQTDVWPEDADFLRHFAAAFGLPPSERRKFLGLSLLGRLWRALYFDALAEGPPELVARLTQVEGWEHFDGCRRDGPGLILLPVHGQFTRLFRVYLRHRGHDGLEVGVTNDKLEQKGLQTPVAKRFELARQLHAAKHLLAQGGIVFNPPDARQNLDNSRSVEFFGRQRQLAAGFAELALKTGAHVVPIAYRFSPRGSFVLEFGARFNVPDTQSTQDERIDSLVGQYASFLRDEWRRYPWNIPWNHLLHYCLLPEVDPGAVLGAIRGRAQALPQ
jgi:lauroyl/myristoyl acyltransferase